MEGGPRIEADGGDADAATSDGDTGAIAGTVIDAIQGVPLAGRSVSIGSATTMTDARGGFSLPAAAGAYDLVVVEADRSVVSVYRALTRRDPLVLHHGTPATAPTEEASIDGTVTGGGPWPLRTGDSAALWFVSPVAKTFEALGTLVSSGGPSFGPMRVLWNGDGAVAGQLYAWGSFAADGGAGGGFYLASQPLSLTPGSDQTLNVALSPSTSTARVTGAIASGATVLPTQALVYFALPGLPGAHIGFVNDGNVKSAFDYTVPSPALPGGSLCLQAASAQGIAGAPVIEDTICGVDSMPTVAAVLQTPPSLPPITKVTPTTKLAWTSFAGGVYELDLLFGTIPSATTPNVYLYTRDTSATWPDLTPEGVPFPQGASYECTIVGLGVFASMDAATGPTGMGSAVVPEFRRSYFPPRLVTLSP